MPVPRVVLSSASRFLLRAALLASVVAGLSGSPAAADEFPSRRIEFVIPLPPGGPTDSAARLLMNAMSPLLGQPLVAINKPGAGGAIAAQYVQNAKPDGYTVLATSNSVLSLNAALQKDLPYRIADFAPIGMFAADVGVILSKRGQPWKDLDGFVAYARANPKTLSYGSAGIGTVSHFAAELFKLSYGLDIVHVPYQGTGPAKAAVVAGHVPIASAAFSAFGELVRSGDLVALATTAPARLKSFPDVPTLAEKGFPEATLNIWIGLFVPAQTPASVVDILTRALGKAMQDPALVASLEKAEMIVDLRDGPATMRQLEAEFALARRVSERIEIKN